MSQATDHMNCKDYKEALTADPGFADGSGHVDSCSECRAYQAEMLALNEKIAAAMDISVPEITMPQLPDLDTEKVVSLASRRAIPKPAWFALAATVVLAAFIGIRMTGTETTYDLLAEQILAHVDHTPSALSPSTTPVSDRRLERAVPASVATINRDTGLITYAQSCRINGRAVPHLIIQGERGPITILLMPEEYVTEAVLLEGENTKGVIIPVGDGSIAIIGDREEQLDRVKQNVLDSVNWST